MTAEKELDTFAKYDIRTIEDILNLTQDQRERCCQDLLALGRMADMDSELRKNTGLSVSRSHFVWVDDNQTGVVSGFTIGGN